MAEREAGKPPGPGASDPGEPGYEGKVTVGEEGGAVDAPTEDFPVTDEKLDEASQDSFPASDPPAYSNPAGAPVDSDPSR